MPVRVTETRRKPKRKGCGKKAGLFLVGVGGAAVGLARLLGRA